ncbi:MAG: hypothetical protein QM762_12605 [Chryseolinea sp.]
MPSFTSVRILREHIIVKVDSVFVDETRYRGVDGMPILINTLFEPEKHVRCWGIVTSVPEELYVQPLVADPVGRPGYHDSFVGEWKTTQDIELEIRDGDKAYFHYNCLLPDNLNEHQYNHLHLMSKKDEQGKLWHYFRVKYDQVFATVRYEPLNLAVKPFDWEDEAKLSKMSITREKKVPEALYGYTEKGIDHIYRKKVVMIGSYVFVQPDFETWDDISIPTPETLNGKVLVNPDGTPRMKPKDQWIVTKSMPRERYLRGWVRHAGTPLKGDKPIVREGMYVYFQRHADTKVDFEGVSYFRMRQRHIMSVDPAKYSLCLN